MYGVWSIRYRVHLLKKGPQSIMISSLNSVTAVAQRGTYRIGIQGRLLLKQDWQKGLKRNGRENVQHTVLRMYGVQYVNHSIVIG